MTIWMARSSLHTDIQIILSGLWVRGGRYLRRDGRNMIVHCTGELYYRHVANSKCVSIGTAQVFEPLHLFDKHFVLEKIL